MLEINALIRKSQWLRNQIFTMVIRQKKGHIPSCFSCVEIMIALYYGGIAKYTFGNSEAEDRDRIIVSKGHAAMVQYPILADIGYFPEDELTRFTQPEGLLGMYADSRIPGIEGISGSLGHGVGMGAGFSWAAKKDDKSFKSFVIVGDGECYEGSTWESAMFAAHHELDNLIAIVDRNKLCILGQTENLLQLGDLQSKWKSFGWHAVTIDGHSYQEILDAFALVGNTNNKPLAIIANTIKGKGVSFMENQPQWHNKMPNDDQLKIAKEELLQNPITH